MNNSHCRFCNYKLIETFVDLGISPLSNAFLRFEHLTNIEPRYPLHAFVCTNCLLVQLEEFETPEKIFSDYVYFSSYSDTWLNHAKNYVEMMIHTFSFDKSNQIIEIASNDGYLLQYFKMCNIPILGIEPAANIASVAEQRGIPTLVKFFSSSTAKELADSGNLADLLIGNNVLAHVPNLNDFVEGLKILLKPDGIITMEFPHLLKLIEKNQFDTIYHEHFSYFSFTVAQKVFASHGLSIFNVEEIPTHGGSLRIYACHEESTRFSIKQSVNDLIEKEKQFGIMNLSVYKNFDTKVQKIKKDLLDLITRFKREGKRIVGYGAAAKGNTLLNYCEIGTQFMDYVVDKNPHKQGLYLPGTHIPIESPCKILETKPDYVLILPWNLKDEIMDQMSAIREWEGKFIIAIPEVRIYP